MDISKALNLLALFFGLLGSVFLTKGVLSLTPQKMLELTPPYSRIDYAPEQINMLSAQKADYLLGFVAVAVGFLVQLGIIFISDQEMKFVWNPKLTVITLLLIIMLFITINGLLYRHYKAEMGKVAIRKHLQDNATTLTKFNNLATLEQMSLALLNLKRNQSESESDFIKRIAAYVGWVIPANAV